MLTAAQLPRIEFLAKEYDRIRVQTIELCNPLHTEDYVVQTASFMSPPRWHLGHTTWFFELILRKYVPGYTVFDNDYQYYFNSYYEGQGERVNKAFRGARSRPLVQDTLLYRKHVDQHIASALLNEMLPEAALEELEIGLNHEQQHQELLVYDLKHLLCDLYTAPRSAVPTGIFTKSRMVDFAPELYTIGWQHSAFAWDNEKPQHKVYVNPFSLSVHPVTVGEFAEFVLSGGYADFRFWQSEGWEIVKAEQWEAPLYWEKIDGNWFVHDFSGLHPIASVASLPVCHVSYYEADAFARFSGKRLPTEFEWEYAASGLESKLFIQPNRPQLANLLESNYLSPVPAGGYAANITEAGIADMIGNVWEWTSSDYCTYPGFESMFPEYNDKWFVNQKVLRGGSFATPASHIRYTYRNFFHPNERWMTSGFRLAQSIV